MGLLRALTDGIVVGAGTLRVERDAVWTADEIFPDLAAEFRPLRRRCGRTEPPLDVIVSAPAGSWISGGASSPRAKSRR